MENGKKILAACAAGAIALAFLLAFYLWNSFFLFPVALFPPIIALLAAELLEKGLKGKKTNALLLSDFFSIVASSAFFSFLSNVLGTASLAASLTQFAILQIIRKIREKTSTLLSGYLTASQTKTLFALLAVLTCANAVFLFDYGAEKRQEITDSLSLSQECLNNIVVYPDQKLNLCNLFSLQLPENAVYYNKTVIESENGGLALVSYSLSTSGLVTITVAPMSYETAQQALLKTKQVYEQQLEEKKDTVAIHTPPSLSFGENQLTLSVDTEETYQEQAVRQIAMTKACGNGLITVLVVLPSENYETLYDSIKTLFSQINCINA